MEEDHDDRVHSGGLPTTTVLKYSPFHHSGKVIVKDSGGAAMYGLGSNETNRFFLF
jgi:hypothetical protein